MAVNFDYQFIAQIIVNNMASYFKIAVFSENMMIFQLLYNKIELLSVLLLDFFSSLLLLF